jgi:hypothetical protein
VPSRFSARTAAGGPPSISRRRTALDDAIRHDLLAHNVAELVEIPRPAKRPPTVLTAEEGLLLLHRQALLVGVPLADERLLQIPPLRVRPFLLIRSTRSCRGLTLRRGAALFRSALR